MQGVVEIHAGEHRKDVSLQESDEQLEGASIAIVMTKGKGAIAASEAAAEQKQDKSAEDMQRDVSGQHVGEETDGMADRAREERDDLNRDDQRQDIDRHAGRHEQLEEVHAVLGDAEDDDEEEHRQRHHDRDDDLRPSPRMCGGRD